MEQSSTRDAVRRVAGGRQPAARHGKRYALVIGINQYQHLRQLENAVRDAKEVAGRLESDFGFQVDRLFDEDATAEKINTALGQCKERYQSEDDLLIFYAGHGTNKGGLAGEAEGYLIPVEARAEDDKTWLAEADIIQQAKGWPAQRVFLVLDACYAGTALRVHDSLEPGARDDQVLKILVAGTENQPVPDGGADLHSPFTKVLLDGLDGLADVGQTPEGIITAEELITYVRAEVPWRSGMRKETQTPVGGSLQGTSGGDDFEFKPTTPRLSASIQRNLISNKAEDRIAAAQQLQDHRGLATARLAAEALTGLVDNARPPEGPATMSDAQLVEVRRTAISALAELGHPHGVDTLTRLLGSDEVEGLRAAAALGLGMLAAQPEGVSDEQRAGLRGSATTSLIAAVAGTSKPVRDAAKEGLGRIPDSGAQLKAELYGRRLPDSSRPDRGQASRNDILDALARLGDHYPEDDQAWLELDRVGDRLRRRTYLAGHRLHPQWMDILRQMLVVGLFAAAGLGLSFVAVTVVALRGLLDLKLALPALLAVSAVPGAVAGAMFVLLPSLGRSLARRADFKGVLVGALIAGISFSLWMSVPNWYLGVGCKYGACPGPYWLLPGLVLGTILGLALVGLPWRLPLPSPDAAEDRGPTVGPVRASLLRRWVAKVASALALAASRIWQSLVVRALRANAFWLFVATLVSALVVAAVRLYPPLAFQRNLPIETEALLWGVGGAVLGASLVLGWCLALPHRYLPATSGLDSAASESGQAEGAGEIGGAVS